MDLARQAASDGFDVVVACGGDGTIHDVANGLIGTEAALGVLPAGTANLWAREVGIDLQLEAAARQLVGSRRRRVDVGRITIDGGPHRHFLLMAGLGFDGAVMARTSRSLTNRLGPLAVVWAGVQVLASARRTSVQIDLDGVAWQGKIAQIVVGNTRRYGGVTRFTPHAHIDDGRLDVCILTTHGLLPTVRQLGSLLLRQRPHRASAITDRVGHLTVAAPHAVPLQLDGNDVRQADGPLSGPGGEVEYTFSVVAQGLTVLVPRDSDGSLFSTNTDGKAL
jgi:YegS/Rv2252/BmrU family lipid kinase